MWHRCSSKVWLDYGVLKKIVLGRDVKFSYKFWKEVFAGFGIALAFSTSYPPHRNGQIKRVNMILENMLRV